MSQDFDASGVAATVRTATPDQMRDLYARVFAGTMGQTVLLDILTKAQVAARRPSDAMGGEARAFHDGRADLALQIFEILGVDPIGVALGVMTADLKGSDHERYERSGIGGPILDEPEPQF